MIALDPGTRRAGIAHFADGGLLFAVDLLTTRHASVFEMTAEVLDAVRRFGVDTACATLLSEYPRNYAAKRASRGDLDGLRSVVRNVETAEPWSKVRRVSPAKWKGQVPKRIVHARVEAALSPDERAASGWAYLGPDARDAIGIGLWWYGRITGPRR